MFELVDTEHGVLVATDDFYDYLLDSGVSGSLEVEELFEYVCDYLEEECA